MELLAHSVVACVFLAGLITCFLPVLPGSCIVWCGVLLHQLWMRDASVGWQVVLLTGGLTTLGLISDAALSFWGAKQFGATWKGALGAVLGAGIGLFLPPPLLWLLLGPILGAIAGELYAGRSLRAGSRAGIGTLLGAAVALALKFGLSLCVIVWFYHAIGL